MATSLDYARLAAYIDADGCITIAQMSLPKDCKKYRQHTLMISISNCDPRLLNWCKDTFESGHVHRRNRKAKPHHRINYVWAVSAQKAEDILRNCLPYFIVKKDQAEIGLAFRTTMTRRQKGIPKVERLSSHTLARREEYKRQLSALKHVEVM